MFPSLYAGGGVKERIILNENEELDSILEDMYLEGYYQAIEEMENPVTNYKARRAAEARSAEEAKERRAVELQVGKAPRKPRNYTKKYAAIGGALGGLGGALTPRDSYKDKARDMAGLAAIGGAVGGAIGKGREMLQQRKQRKYEEKARQARLLYRATR